MSDEKPQPNLDMLMTLLTEQGDELRARGQVEHLYAAASIGSFGAVVWGMSALPAVTVTTPTWQHPAIIAAVGVTLSAFAVVVKIKNDHEKYEAIKRARAKIAERLVERVDCADILPKVFTTPNEGLGYFGAITVTIVAAVAASAFCLTVAFREACKFGS